MNHPEVDTTAGRSVSDPEDSQPNGASDIPFSELATLTAVVFVAVTVVLLIVFQYSKQSGSSEDETEYNQRQRVLREEMPLGEFHCVTSAPSEVSKNCLQVVEFEATAVVRGTGYELLQMGDRIRYYSARIGQQLDHTARSASPEELGDPSLTLLRQRMKDRVNEVFGAELVEEVIFGRFRTFDIPNPGVLSH